MVDQYVQFIYDFQNTKSISCDGSADGKIMLYFQKLILRFTFLPLEYTCWFPSNFNRPDTATNLFRDINSFLKTRKMNLFPFDKFEVQWRGVISEFEK